VVGTRTASNYGKKQCDSIIQELASTRLSIVSGMAYGIDIHAHRAALKYNLPTLAVVAHGLDRLYPSVHKDTLDLMFENGGVITEFMSGSNPDRENFPKRNRIIAGFSDATLVVESGARGGSMISAEIAASYNRDVFAVPGNNGSRMSEGCNYLIHTQKATLVRGGKDIKKVMNWIDKRSADPVQTSLFTDLNEDERKLLSYLHHKGASTIDTISIEIGLPISKTSVHLLNLEFKGLIVSLPGKVYRTV
jgi:DNA processing protein